MTSPKGPPIKGLVAIMSVVAILLILTMNSLVFVGLITQSIAKIVIVKYVSFAITITLALILSPVLIGLFLIAKKVVAGCADLFLASISRIV